MRIVKVGGFGNVRGDSSIVLIVGLEFEKFGWIVG